MSSAKSFFSSRSGIISAGIFIGIFAAVLQKLGNPGNMGICVACMERDIAGALGLHRAETVQYLRPEIMGFVFGSLIAALMFREFRARTGSAPLVRFFLGFFAMVGALMFLGCPWRTLLRLAGGDGNALVGFAGLAGGIWVGVLFLRSGYSLGRSSSAKQASGWLMPVFMGVLLFFAILQPQFASGGPIFSSIKGPGAAHAPLAISLGVGLGVGFLAQRTRFCTMGSVRDIILMRDFHLFSGVLALTAAALMTNLILGQFHPGFVNQPIAHNSHIWNFLGMALAGMAFALAGGCPGRQLILSGEGDADAAVFVLGMIAGAGVAHNFALASSAKGPSAFGPGAVIIGILFCLFIGWSMRERS